MNDELVKVKEDSHKKIAELEEKIREKDTSIHKFEMFVDLCNASVMRQREKLEGLGGDSNNVGNSS